MARKKTDIKLSFVKNYYKVSVLFVENVLGSQSALNEWFLRKRIDDLRKEIQKLEKALQAKSKPEKEKLALEDRLLRLQAELNELQTILETGIWRDPDKHESILESLTNRLTTFARPDCAGDKGSAIPTIVNYQILGLFKESAKNVVELSGARNLLTKYVLIAPRYIKIFRLDGSVVVEPDGIVERSLSAYNRSVGGQVTTLVASEYIKKPAMISFIIETINTPDLSLHPFEDENLMMLAHVAGEFGGLLQWRNAYFGRFTVLEFEKIKTEEFTADELRKRMAELRKALEKGGIEYFDVSLFLPDDVRKLAKQYSAC